MANRVGDIFWDDDVRKALDPFLVDALPDADPGGLGLGVHLGERSFDDGHAKGQALGENCTSDL